MESSAPPAGGLRCPRSKSLPDIDIAEEGVAMPASAMELNPSMSRPPRQEKKGPKKLKKKARLSKKRKTKILSATATAGGAASSKIPMRMTGDELDISLYFHIPFCSKKCPYCHFFVLPDKEEYKQPFVDALLKEWDLRLPQIQHKRVVSIYFGGGTPTKLPPSAYEKILGQIAHSETEITLEANPEDVTLSAMQQYKAAGINRVSLGLQSLDDRELTQLGRTHHAAKAIEAVHTVHRAGITNISGDLMTALGFSPRELYLCIFAFPPALLLLYDPAVEYQLFKISVYLPHLPPEEIRLQMLQMAVQSLESFGFNRYEISAFAKPGMHSRHNTGYWTGRPFLGFGPSAFSYWKRGSRM